MSVRFWAQCGHPVAPYQGRQPERCATCGPTTPIKRPVVVAPPPVVSAPEIIRPPIDWDNEVKLTPTEVGAMLRVDPKTVSKWAKAGQLSCIRTIGGHRRFAASEIEALLAGDPS